MDKHPKECSRKFTPTRLPLLIGSRKNGHPNAMSIQGIGIIKPGLPWSPENIREKTTSMTGCNTGLNQVNKGCHHPGPTAASVNPCQRPDAYSETSVAAGGQTITILARPNVDSVGTIGRLKPGGGDLSVPVCPQPVHEQSCDLEAPIPEENIVPEPSQGEYEIGQGGKQISSHGVPSVQEGNGTWPHLPVQTTLPLSPYEPLPPISGDSHSPSTDVVEQRDVIADPVVSLKYKPLPPLSSRQSPAVGKRQEATSYSEDSLGDDTAAGVCQYVSTDSASSLNRPHVSQLAPQNASLEQPGINDTIIAGAGYALEEGSSRNSVAGASHTAEDRDEMPSTVDKKLSKTYVKVTHSTSCTIQKQRCTSQKSLTKTSDEDLGIIEDTSSRTLSDCSSQCASSPTLCESPQYVKSDSDAIIIKSRHSPSSSLSDSYQVIGKYRDALPNKTADFLRRSLTPCARSSAKDESDESDSPTIRELSVSPDLAERDTNSPDNGKDSPVTYISSDSGELSYSQMLQLGRRSDEMRRRTGRQSALSAGEPVSYVTLESSVIMAPTNQGETPSSVTMASNIETEAPNELPPLPSSMAALEPELLLDLPVSEDTLQEYTACFAEIRRCLGVLLLETPRLNKDSYKYL